MSKILVGISSFLFLLPNLLFAQFEIDTVVLIKHTPICDQQMSGTCWAFATTSFLESEILRINPHIKDIDLSEMFFVYYNYLNKFQRYYLRHGHIFWTMGGQPHDVLKIVYEKGFIPEFFYPGYTTFDHGHNHSHLDTALKMMVSILDFARPMVVHLKAFTDTLEYYLGKIPAKFFYQEKTYTPLEFSKSMNIDARNYVNLTSYAHHPYDEWFVLENRFNWADVLFFNLPWNEFESICDSALLKGYSFVWNGDVTEKSFNYMNGLASWDEKITAIESERRDQFFSHKTNVDHVMHVVGLASIDKKKYYVVKNSWGQIGRFNGYILMSADYFRLKTVSITLSMEALPPDVIKKMSKKYFYSFMY